MFDDDTFRGAAAILHISPEVVEHSLRRQEELRREDEGWEYIDWCDTDDPTEHDFSGTAEEFWDRRARLYSQARMKFERAKRAGDR